MGLFICGLIALSGVLYRLVGELETQVEQNSRWYGEAIWQISQTERALQNLRLALATGGDIGLYGPIYIGQGRVLPNMPVFHNMRFVDDAISAFGRNIEEVARLLADGDFQSLALKLDDQRDQLMELSVKFAVRSDITPELFKSQRSLYRMWVAGLLALLICSLIACILFYDQLQRMQQKRAEARRINIERIGLFAAGIVHEFNTRLSALRWAWDRAVIGDPMQESVNAYALLNHMSDLTDRMLLLARGSSHLQMNEFLFDDFVLQEEAVLMDIVGPDIELDMSGCRGPIWFDRVHLRSVLSEALANARDAMGGRGKIVLHYENNLLTIRDTGPGIKIEDRDRCFEPSYTTKGINGTGLGLAVIQSIITAAEGSVDLTTHRQGGAVLSIRFKAREV
ncbi:sensor histidine kinase [Thalassospira xiamenensis]|uniref:sensor histidine kinase n=1 Tax=Thalassospira xiamenensis TaxID=220697 RepID=UPI001C68D4AC|nr:ATP-binding protein [Thalassospira xiamenensis]